MASNNVSAVNSVASSRSGTPQPNTALGERSAGEDASKLKTFLSILKKFIGVSDMAAVRFSLPAQLLEPIPNLEYWHYIDRPDAFAAIGDSDDPVGRMLGCLRFWFTKDLVRMKRAFVLLITHTNQLPEICAWQALQAIQLHTRRVLQSEYRQPMTFSSQAKTFSARGRSPINIQPLSVRRPSRTWYLVKAQQLESLSKSFTSLSRHHITPRSLPFTSIVLRRVFLPEASIN